MIARHAARGRWFLSAGVGIAALTALGCAPNAMQADGPLVIVLDGAGWAGSASQIRAGLKDAGYRGGVYSFAWTSFLGAGPDHLMVQHKRRKAGELAELIVKRRRTFPRQPVHVVGLSAGTAVAVFALEALPRGTNVDNVVLFAPSISSTYDLSGAMKHVRGSLYATCSGSDGILNGVVVAADGEAAEPAGLYGFRIPGRIQCYECYTRVANIPWRSVYADLGWRGGHTGATHRRFVGRVVAPRLMSAKATPMNKPLASPWMSQWRGSVSDARRRR